MINPEIFKAYDIRGIYNQDFNDQFAYKLGLAYGQMRQQETGKNKLTLAVGEDMRLSSPALKKELITGLIASGTDVVDIGLAATPTFYFAVANYNYDGGILVSASHNPKEYNGFKLVRERALPVGRDSGIFTLREKILAGKATPADTPGKITKREGVLADQVKHDLDYVDLKLLKPFKVVIDPANAMGSLYFNELSKYIPGEIIKINWELDGTFPAHEADPFKKENIKELSKQVIVNKADLGIATDGDGDRIFFVDDKGEQVEPGILRAILCKIFLQDKPGAKIVYDIRPGKITPDIITANNGIPIVSVVGHSLIKEKMIATGAFFAGESSGHFFLNMPHGCYEVPVIVTLKILTELSQAKIPFSEYIKPYQKYFHSSEINSRVADPVAKIKEIKEKYSDGQQNDADGISVEYPEFWFNVRPSNTEPLLRLNLEAVNEKTMQVKTKEIIDIIRS